MDENSKNNTADSMESDGEQIITVRTSSTEVVQQEKVQPEAETEIAAPQTPAKKKRMQALMTKRALIGAAAGFAVFAFGVAGYVLTKPNNTAPATSQSQPTARLGVAVTVLDGTAKYSTNGADWQELTTQTELAEGHSIQTDAASRVVLALDDGSAIRMSESTSITLDNLAVDEVRILNNAGQVYSRVVESDRTYAVVVEDTAYTALGTAFNTVNNETDKGVQVLQSSVSVEGVEAKVDEGKQYFKAHAKPELKDTLSDVSVEELKSSSFMIWNLEQDESSEEFKDKLGYLAKMKETTEPVPAPATTTSQIKLTASKSDKGVVLKWSLSGVSAPEGFKVVRSKKTSLPTYGKDESNFVSADARSYTWGVGSGGLYTYRVCVYLPDQKTCTPYSNAVQIESPEILPEQPVQGEVNLSLVGMVASWTDTGTAPHGWKLLVSASPSPTYGGDNVKTYYGGTPREIESLEPGTYYVRVCKYTASYIDNGCTNYSNQVQLTVPTE